MMENMTVFYSFSKKQTNKQTNKKTPAKYCIFLHSILHAIIDWNDENLS